MADERNGGISPTRHHHDEETRRWHGSSEQRGEDRPSFRRTAAVRAPARDSAITTSETEL